MNKTDQMSFLGFEAEPAAEVTKPVKAKTNKPAATVVKRPDLMLAESAQPDMPLALRFNCGHEQNRSDEFFRLRS